MLGFPQLKQLYQKKQADRGLTDITNVHARQIKKLRDFFYTKAETSTLHQIISIADKNYFKSLVANFKIVLDNKKEETGAHKELHGKHHNKLNQLHIDKEASNKWLSNGNLFSKTEEFILTIQDQVIYTNDYKKYL